MGVPRRVRGTGDRTAEDTTNLQYERAVRREKAGQALQRKPSKPSGNFMPMPTPLKKGKEEFKGEREIKGKIKERRAQVEGLRILKKQRGG